MADSTTGNCLLVEDYSDVGAYSAFFEDNCRVAYAYLRDGDEIVADVWLYNQGEPPDEPEWRDPSKMPFANPKGFADPDAFVPVTDAAEISFVWTYGEEGTSPTLNLFIRGERFAKLVPGSKPGWSKLAIRDGPLALRMKDDN